MADDIIPMPVHEGPYRTPRSIIDAVSDIQQYTVMESDGVSDIPEGFLTIRRYLAYVNIGFIYGLGDNLLVWIISPFLYGVLFNYISIFGHDIPTLFDKAFTFILSKYITFGLLFLMIYLLLRAKGNLSRGCTSALSSGYALALVIRAIVFLFIYRYLYSVWPDVCAYVYNLGEGLKNFGLPFPFIQSVSSYITYMATRMADTQDILLLTSNYETFFSLAMLAALGGAYIGIRLIGGRLSANPYFKRFDS